MDRITPPVIDTGKNGLHNPARVNHYNNSLHDEVLHFLELKNCACVTLYSVHKELMFHKDVLHNSPSFLFLFANTTKIQVLNQENQLQYGNRRYSLQLCC